MTEKNGNLEAARRIQEAMRKTKDLKTLLDQEKNEESRKIAENYEQQRKQDQFGFIVLVLFLAIISFVLIIKSYN